MRIFTLFGTNSRWKPGLESTPLHEIERLKTANAIGESNQTKKASTRLWIQENGDDRGQDQEEQDRYAQDSSPTFAQVTDDAFGCIGDINLARKAISQVSVSLSLPVQVLLGRRRNIRKQEKNGTPYYLDWSGPASIAFLSSSRYRGLFFRNSTNPSNLLIVTG
jgi:hypothetical protein